MKKIAFLFPGQGSQKVGMGQDLYAQMDEVKQLFDTADEICGLPVTRLCFEGPMDELTRTVNLQPAVTVVNLALLGALRKQGVQPAVCAGHSLGEFSALAAAGVIEAADCLKLVFKRGQLMDREATRNPGAMSAIVGLNIEQINAIALQAAQYGVVAVANHNSAEQIVITGAPEAVRNAGEMAAEQGARAIPLKVSGAWHSPLIQGAEQEFEAFLETIEFRRPLCPVVQNVTADATADPAQIRRIMARQLCSPVRWYEAMLNIIDQQVDAFVEVGPGRVLTGLLKKIRPQAPAARIHNVMDLKTLEKFLEAEA